MSVNCIEIFTQQVKERPKAMALCFPLQETVTFQELLDGGIRAQSLFLSLGVGPGSSVLLLDSLSPQLYSSMVGLLALGATVILVEPWMPVKKVQQAIELARPQVFLSNSLGFLWGARIQAIRKIPHWVRTSSIGSASTRSSLQIEKADPKTPGILTFTSGTTGNPKGVVRSQGYMIRQHEVLSRHLESHRFRGPDLCIFANFVLSNLASGRGSVLVPSSWKPKVLKALDHLPRDAKPETLTTGPGFLLELMKNASIPSLKSVHMGGALIDCWIFEKGFEYWPNAHWSHIYGGSEVEPVAVTSARKAVHESRKRGFFQTLYLGNPVSEIQAQTQSDGLWVAGPHVCPEYLGNEKENQLFKRKDANGVLWHFMGDRVREDEAGWWYQGRSGQTPDDFALEQKICQKVQSSKCFVQNHPLPSGTTPQKCLVGEGVSKRKKELQHAFPELHRVVEARIYRDRRHRARIDRNKTLQKGASWLLG